MYAVDANQRVVAGGDVVVVEVVVGLVVDVLVEATVVDVVGHWPCFAQHGGAAPVGAAAATPSRAQAISRRTLRLLTPSARA
jgi:hypothetical protein